MSALIDLFRPRRRAARAAAAGSDAASPALFADLANAGAADIDPARRLEILDEAEAIITKSMKSGTDVDAYNRSVLMLAAISECRKFRNLYF